MGWWHRTLLFISLCALIQVEFSCCESFPQQDGDQSVGVPNDSSSETDAEVELLQTRGPPEEKAKIINEIKRTIAEKELLRKERQSFLKSEREKNLAKTEDLKQQFLEEEAMQKKEKDTLQAAKSSWQAASHKAYEQMRSLQRQARRLRFSNPERKKLDQEVEAKELEREQMKKKYDSQVKSIMRARKSRVAELQTRADKVMAERRKTEEEVEREMAEMDGIMKAFDFELMELRAELQKVQS